MKQKIKNRGALLSHGDAESRRIVLDVAEATLQRLDVPLLDHLLVGGEGDHSMRDRGELLMGAFTREVARVSERYMGPLLPARNLREGEDEDWLSFEDE